MGGSTSNTQLLKSLLDARRIEVDGPDMLAAVPFSGVPIPEGRLRGMLLGLAIGDALGNTSESLIPAARFKRRGEITDYLGNWHASRRGVGLPSDDTQMAFWTIESILECGGIDPVDLAEKFSTRQIYGRGQSVGEFVRNYRHGTEWPEASSRSAGNGALMRIAAVLAAHKEGPSPDFWSDAVLCAAVTHNDTASISACVAFVGILQELVHMNVVPAPEWWVDRYVFYAAPLEGKKAYGPRGGEYAGAFSGTLSNFVQLTVSDALKQNLNTLDACNKWFSGAYLLETVPSVLMVLAKHANDPEEAIKRAVNDTKDNDTIAAIVGAAIGALHGEDSLPTRWIDRLLGRTAQNDDGRVFELLDALMAQA
jgi:ADP-ribosyl-[dinitrogen reductase] hydrolase